MGHVLSIHIPFIAFFHHMRSRSFFPSFLTFIVYRFQLSIVVDRALGFP